MPDRNNECARKWWMISGGIGVLVALILGVVLGMAGFGSILSGIIVGGVMGYLTVRSQCSAAEVESAQPATPAFNTTSAGVASQDAAGDATANDAAKGDGPAPPEGSSGVPVGVGMTEMPNAQRGVEGEEPESPAPEAQGEGGTALRSAALDEVEAESQAVAEDPATADAFLDAPRGGKADDLKRIKGIGPKLEARLNSVGLYHHDQIAALTEAQMTHIDEELDLRGRITRDDWIGQAAALATDDN